MPKPEPVTVIVGDATLPLKVTAEMDGDGDAPATEPVDRTKPTATLPKTSEPASMARRPLPK